MCIGREKGSGQNQSFNCRTNYPGNFASFWKFFWTPKTLLSLLFYLWLFLFFCKKSKKKWTPIFHREGPLWVRTCCPRKKALAKTRVSICRTFFFWFWPLVFESFCELQKLCFLCFFTFGFFFFFCKKSKKKWTPIFHREGPLWVRTCCPRKKALAKTRASICRTNWPGNPCFFFIIIFKNQRESWWVGSCGHCFGPKKLFTHELGLEIFMVISQLPTHLGVVYCKLHAWGLGMKELSTRTAPAFLPETPVGTSQDSLWRLEKLHSSVLTCTYLTHPSSLLSFLPYPPPWSLWMRKAGCRYEAMWKIKEMEIR